MKSFSAPISAFLLIIAIQCLDLQAEIEKVVITWTPMKCQNWCIQEIDKQFRRVPEIAEVEVNKEAGQANITWQKNARFDYMSVNMVMHQLGLAIRDIRLKVRGHIRHTDKTVTLVSSGDLTTFDLINAVIPQSTAQSVQFNLAARALQPDMRQKLLEAEAQKQEVTIDGPLFMPHRAPPLVLAAEHVNFPPPDDAKQKNKLK